ncbi:hypothetical protein CK203_058899 [Vitis vinifera]|uniref:Uncharacterized protein n=1 Tax=Vitis vinifera TaxID=29760 RepID=A0A438FS64_VITVI|nr:hypothetical protein CK203_058899 [Vitis vinifera]
MGMRVVMCMGKYGGLKGWVGGFGIPMEMSMAWVWWAAGYENGCERNEATVWVQRGDGVGFIKVVDLGKPPPANAAGWNYMNAVLENYSLGVTCHGYTRVDEDNKKKTKHKKWIQATSPYKPCFIS